MAGSRISPTRRRSRRGRRYLSRLRPPSGVTVVAFLLVAGGCSDSSSSTTPTGPPTISVLASGSELQIGQAVHFTAQVRNDRGDLLESVAVVWSTSDASIVMVEPETGVGRAEGDGVAQITASSGGASGSMEVAVLPPPIESVTLVGLFRIKAGESQEYEVIQELADGRVVHRPVTWTTSDPSIATASQDGVVTAHRPGEFQLILSIDGVDWVATLTVFDWVSAEGDGYLFTWIESQIPVENRFGQERLPRLVFGCGVESGFFFVWVDLEGFITASGLVVYSFDDEEIESATWSEGSDFDVLFHPGPTNLHRKNFASRIAGALRFGFGFSEFNASARATFFRVAGLQPHLEPLLAGCPSNALMEGPSEAESLRIHPPGGTAAMEAWRGTRAAPSAPSVRASSELDDARARRRVIDTQGEDEVPARLQPILPLERKLTPAPHVERRSLEQALEPGARSGGH